EVPDVVGLLFTEGSHGIDARNSAVYASIEYILGNPEAKTAFYAYTLLILLYVSIFVLLWKRDRRGLTAVTAATTVGVLTESPESSLALAVVEWLQTTFHFDFAQYLPVAGVSRYHLLVVLLGVATVVLWTTDLGSSPDEHWSEHETSNHTGDWELLARVTGYLVVATAVGVVLAGLVGFPRGLVTAPDVTRWGLGHVVGFDNYLDGSRSRLLASVLLFVPTVLVYRVVQRGSLRARWLTAGYVGFLGLPAVHYTTPVPRACAAAAVLLAISAAAQTVATKTDFDSPTTGVDV
ncbi:MAG: hypothetical protein ABEH80_03295, partial [Halobaculum sp.]